MKLPLIALAACVAIPALAQAEDISLTPIPLDAATIDLSGIWNYATGNHQNSGPCPGGTAMSGMLDIAQTADGAVSLHLVSGATCDPASMCYFDGAIQAGNLVVSNTDIVDEEGGSATNAMIFYFFDQTTGAGRSSSRYVHPEGMECNWTHQVELRRPE